MKVVHLFLSIIFLTSHSPTRAMEDETQTPQLPHQTFPSKKGINAGIFLPRYLIYKPEGTPHLEAQDAWDSPNSWHQLPANNNGKVGNQILTYNGDGKSPNILATSTENGIQTWRYEHQDGLVKKNFYYTGTQPPDPREYFMCFSQDGKQIIYSRINADNNGITLFFDVESGKTEKEYKTGYNFVDYKGVLGLIIDYNHDNKTTAASYVLESGNLLQAITIPSNNVSVSPNCRLLASCIENIKDTITGITIINTEDSIRQSISFYPRVYKHSQVWSKFSSSGALLAVAQGASLINVYNPCNGAHVYQLPGPENYTFKSIQIYDDLELICTMANKGATCSTNPTEDSKEADGQITVSFARKSQQENTELKKYLASFEKNDEEKGTCIIQ